MRERERGSPPKKNREEGKMEIGMSPSKRRRRRLAPIHTIYKGIYFLLTWNNLTNKNNE
jgi:hypothetical protein